MDKNLLEEQQADYQCYETAGSHHDIGRLTAERGGSSVHEEISGVQLEYARACKDVVQSIYPEMVEEFRGYAEGLGMKEEELLWHYSLGVKGGCSGIAVQTNEGMLVGRNYDFYYWENRRHLIGTRPDRGFSQIGMHEGLVGGRFDGLNERGLFVSFNAAGPHPEKKETPGMSFHLIVRYLLEKCSSASEARDVLMELPVIEPKSYLLADANEAYVVEVHMDHREYREMEDYVIVMTNHFLHPNMKKYCPAWPNSSARYEKLTEGAEAINKANDPQRALQDVLSDHEAPVCGHKDGLATFWSCTADLNNKEICYSLGAPCRNDYKQYFSF
ncbi:MAG TPA: C45 family peptidase [Bacillales bacterium]|nr:C45 family peptidase [Bacillales bacterium]